MSAWIDKENMLIPSLWPDFIREGFGIIYGEAIPPQKAEAFLACWGDISSETFLRILSEGEGVDRVIAISILGKSELPRVREQVLPFLRSTHPQERWVSAMALGTQKEDAALPVLITMLTEYFPAWEYEHELDNPTWFEEHRLCIPGVLDIWDDPSLVVPLRQALIASLAIQQTSATSIGPFLGSSLRFYQQNLTRSLGCRGAFGVLTGLMLSTRMRKAFIVNMVLGYCRIKEDVRFLEPPWQRDIMVREAMGQVLQQRFGLSEQEQDAYLRPYTRFMSSLDNDTEF